MTKTFDFIDLHHTIIILQEIIEHCVGWWLLAWWSSSHKSDQGQFTAEASTVTGPLAIFTGFHAVRLSLRLCIYIEAFIHLMNGLGTRLEAVQCVHARCTTVEPLYLLCGAHNLLLSKTQTVTPALMSI